MQARWPKLGRLVTKNQAGWIHHEHINLGYIMVQVFDADPRKKFKVQLTKGDKKQNFSIMPVHDMVPIPMVFGSGDYTIVVARHASGAAYTQALAMVKTCTLVDEFTTWLYPTAYCNYFADSKCIALTNDICKAAKSSLENLQIISKAIMDLLEYDDDLAANVDSWWIPVPDDVLQAKKSICWGYSSLAAALLRSQGIPTKIAVGRVDGGIMHSWIEAYITETGFIEGAFPIKANEWNLLDLTIADSLGGKKAYFNQMKDHQYVVEYYG